MASSNPGPRLLRRLSIGAIPLLALFAGCIASRTPTGLDGGGGGGGATGAVQITVTTSGSSLDPDGYQLIFNELNAQAVGINTDVTFPNVPIGSYQVTLADVAINCEVQGGSSSKAFSVSADATTTVEFDVSCE